MSETVLAIDIGGTKIAAAVVDADGTILTDELHPTVASSDPETVFAGVESAVRGLLDDLQPAGDRIRVGISSAGPIDGPAGTISPVNIGAWRGFEISARVRAVLAETYGADAVSVGLAGDGHCFALGEHWLGAGRDVASMMGVVLSTGVGGGVVVDNRLFAGSTGNAVHLGHISVNAWGPRCVCGGHGCTEMYARGPALVAAARETGIRLTLLPVLYMTGGFDRRPLSERQRRFGHDLDGFLRLFESLREI
jgi:glucokinase